MSETASLQISEAWIEEPKPGRRADGEDFLITHTTTAEGVCVFVRRAQNGTILVDIDVSEAGVEDAPALIVAHDDMVLFNTEPRQRPACVVTGAPGENEDDCTTHDHEGTARAVDYAALTDAQRETLDDLVHDTASQIASNANNAGAEGQVEFLLSNGCTLDQIKKELDSDGA